MRKLRATFYACILARMTTYRTALAVTVAGLALGLSACGSSGATSDASTPGGSASTECSTVWQAGKTLPKTYEGCMKDGRLQITAMVGSGDCLLAVAPGGEAWAKLGDIVHVVASGEAADDEGYRAAYFECNK